MWFSIVPRKEICGNSGIHIAMVPRSHQCNVYIKRELRVWKDQKCIPLLGSKTVLTNTSLQTSQWCSTGPRIETCVGSGVPIVMVPRFHQRNFCIKRKLRVWRDQKCILLLGSKTVLTNTGLQTSQGCSIGPRIETCVGSGVPIVMVPRFHQRNFCIKKKLRI